MAQQKIGHDPAAAALSAIEEALSLSPDEILPDAHSEGNIPAPEAAAESLELKLPHVNKGAEHLEKIVESVKTAPEPTIFAPSNKSVKSTDPMIFSAAPAKAAAIAPSTPPANDDRRVAGQVAQAMQIRPSRWPLVLALLVSMLWLGLVGYYIAGEAGITTLEGATGITRNAHFPAWLLLAVGPVLAFLVAAAQVRRIQEIRQSAQSMTKVAMRLAEPETMATEQVVTLSQAIRREVASMGDGIERALARASELETMVRTEVSNLERSYTDNERRIRVLVDGLSSEREAIVTHSDRVRSAISGAHEKLSLELDTVSRTLADRVSDAGTRVTSSLGAKGEEIFMQLGSTNELILQQLSAQSGEIVTRLNSSKEDIAATIDNRIGELDEHFRTTSSTLLGELGAIGDELNTRLGTTGRQIADNVAEHSSRLTTHLDQTSDKLNTTVNVHGELLTSRLAETGERIAALLGEHTATAHANFTNSADAIASMLDEKTGYAHQLFGASGDHIASILDERTAIAHENFTNSAQAISALIDDKTSHAHTLFETSGDRIAGLLSDKTAAAHEIFQASGDAFVAMVDQHQSHVHNELARHANMLSEHFVETSGHALQNFAGHSTNLIEGLNQTVATAAERLNQHSDMFDARLAMASERAVGAITTHGDSFHDAFRATTENALETFVVQTEGLDARIASAAERASEAIRLHGDTFHTTFQDTANAALHALAEQGQSLDQGLSGTAERAVAAIRLHGDTFHTTFQNTAQGAIHTLNDQGTAFNARFADTANSALHAFNERASHVDQSFALTASEAITAIGMHGERVNQTLAERLNTFEESILRHGGDLANRVAMHSDRITTTVDAKLGAVDAAFTTHGDAFLDKLDQRTRDTSQTLEAQVVEFEQRAANKSQEISHSLDSLISKIDAGLDTRSRALNDMLAHRALDVAKVLGEGGREVTRALDAKANEIDQILLNRSTALTETLSGKAEEINRTLGGRATEIADTLDERISRFEDRVVRRLDAVSAELDGRGKSVADILRERAVEIDGILQAHHASLTAGTTNVRSLLENEGLGLVEALSQRGGDVAREIAQIGDLVTRAIESRGSAIVGHMAQKQGEFTSAIDASSASLRANIETNAAASVASLTRTHDKVNIELTTLLAELGRRNATLESLSQDAARNLGLVEANLAERVHQFDTALSTINTQVAALAQTSAATIRDASSLAERLDVHGRALVATSQELGRSQAEIDAALAARVDGLEHLLARVNEKSDDLDNVMRAFAGMIDDSFTSAESRAREIGSFLVESTQSAQTTIGQHYDAIRATTGKERERTATALRAAYEQAKAEMEEIFAGTAERFKGSTEELLAMSNAIRRELDATRAELRRSAAELPQETAAQAATLRRVVADQISALNELTDVASRSGRALDLAEPVQAAPIQRAPEPRRYAEPAPVPRAPEPRAEPVRAPETRPSEMRMDPSRFAPPPAPREEFNRQRPPVAPAPRQLTTPVPQERGPGWMSDLLNRASREEKVEGLRPSIPPRSAAQAIDSLDSISLDIARMIDHDASIELWDRYRAGERNVFTRRLYTSAGQKTFDEIRRRYRSDHEFRQTVDRYTVEFERLLTEINRDDRDGTLTRSYLASDTGKVYTMLAHAAGRFE